MKRKYNWSWIGFILGPAYLLICGAYLPGVVILFVYYIVLILAILVFTTTKFYFLISLLLGIYCGLNAERFIKKPMQEKQSKFTEFYKNKGYTGRELSDRVRKRSLSLIHILSSAILAIFIYWAAKIIISLFAFLLAINIQ